MGHAGPEAIRHLEIYCRGARVTLRGPFTKKCIGCARAKVKNLISRRRPDYIYITLFQKVHIDWFDVVEGIDGIERVMFIICEATGIMMSYFLTSKRESGSLKALILCSKWLRERYNLRISVIRSNNELIKGNATKAWLEKSGITFELFPPYTQDFNGVAERMGEVMFHKSRSMRVQAKLPYKLWREVVLAGVYLHNRTPKAKNDWNTFYTLFQRYIAKRDGIKGPITPEIAHLKAYGCTAYAATAIYKQKKARLRKLDPWADIGYLVGYDSTNIYRVWIPHTGKVISTRDVIFDESKFFNGKTEFLSSEEMAVLDDLVQKIELPKGVAINEAITEEIDEEVFEPVPEAEAENTGTTGADLTF
jgi:hypothetical protein